MRTAKIWLRCMDYTEATNAFISARDWECEIDIRMPSPHYWIFSQRHVIYTTKIAACVCVSVCLCVCVCVCVCKIWPISARTLSFRHRTSRKFFSHSKFPIPYLWTAFCVPLSFVFFTKNNNLEIVTVTTQDRPLNCKQQQPLPSVVQWYSAQLRSWRSEFKPHTSSPNCFNTLLFAINNVYF